MTEKHDEFSLELRMEEVSHYPPDNPLRMELEEELRQGPAQYREQWLEVLKENEQFRLALPLSKNEVPTDLSARLMDISREHHPVQFNVQIWKYAAAAMVLCLVGLQLFWQGKKSVAPNEGREVMLMALNDHINPGVLSVRTSDPHQLVRALQSKVSLDLQLPHMGKEYTLVGGRISHWGSSPVFCTQWKKGDNMVTLIQYDCSSMGVTGTCSRKVVCCPKQHLTNTPTDLVVWSDNNHGYAMVGCCGEFKKRPQTVAVLWEVGDEQEA